MKKIIVSLLVIIVLFASSIFLFTTIYVIQPIGALPEGITIIALKNSKFSLIESPDSICEKINGKVNLICRMSALNVITQSTILVRLPYSEYLYLKSTDGKQYQ
jgi:hypothetical protein